ncbi:hypothetical protein [Brevundimonas vesicularis]|uniref:hypothetical protein n=1 Tax=Brevundimonas vesicularis TaxID=41276 RepID=UPI0028ABAE26|nr:hypothetical protein [Brevundimonas vesicularis]
MTQAPTPGPLSAAIDMLSEARDFIDRFSDVRDGDYGAPEPNAAMVMVHEINATIEQLAAPTAPVEASGSEREHGPKCWGKTSISDEMMYCYCGSTDSPPGETREALDRLKMAAHVYEDDEMAADCATLEALLSARPLALGGQKGDSETLRVLLDNLVIAQTLSKDIRQKATDEARSYLYDLRHTPQPSGETREAVRLALEDADALDRVSEEADDNQWQDWAATMRQAASRIRRLALLSARPLASGGQQRVGLAASEIGAHIAKRDAEYESALADLTITPDASSLDEFGRSIFGALSDCPAMSIDKQADFVARALWPALSTAPARAEAQDEGAAGERFQDRCGAWLDVCFGPESRMNVEHRNARFLEEAVELVQASGMTEAAAADVVRYAFSRPQGEINQEVGGVMMTLAAHCLATGVDMTAEGERELARVWTKVDQIRAKEAAKPSFAHPSPPPAADEDRVDAERFRALMRCGRIKMQGSSGVDPHTLERNGNNVHFGAEFWPEPYDPAKWETTYGASTRWGRACLRHLADAVIETEAALKSTAAKEGGAA